jgi:NADH-quinone oxidoreductase subunit H
MADALFNIFNIFVFPGFLFVAAFGLAAEYFDRKLYALMQNRIGPPWFQPLADFIKLSAKEDVVPQHADTLIFKLMPIIAITSILTSFFYIPMWGSKALFAFKGDIVVVVYLLTVPTLTYFLGGWYSRSVYSMIGAGRSLTQLFAYEIPLFLSVLAPAMLADTWSLSGISEYFSIHPWAIPFWGNWKRFRSIYQRRKQKSSLVRLPNTAGDCLRYSDWRLIWNWSSVHRY